MLQAAVFASVSPRKLTLNPGAAAGGRVADLVTIVAHYHSAFGHSGCARSLRLETPEGQALTASDSVEVTMMSCVPLSAVRRTARFILTGATALLLPACTSEDVVGPRRVESDPAPRFSFMSTPGLPRLHSNRVKYRDHGKKPATGRAGSAQLSVRALFGPSTGGQVGETLVEVTTGTFDDGATPPGKLKKIQITQLDDAGRVLSSRFFNKLGSGGYAQYVYPNAIPGSTIQVTAQVTGIKGARTDVVTVQEQVRIRPDLAATDLQAPSRSVPHAPVNISALVRELNGEVGARADCVLQVDGVEVDRAASIWVDANSAVNCAFTHAFPVEGTKHLKVLVQRVTPGDWDTSNNATTGQITIGTLRDFYYEADVKEYEARHRVRVETNGTAFSLSTNTFLWTHNRVARLEDDWIDHQFAHHVVWMPAKLEFPFDVEMSHSTDGIALGSLKVTGLEAQWGQTGDGVDRGSRYSCAADYIEGEGVQHLYQQVCTFLDYVIDGSGTRQEFPLTQVVTWRWAGDVTYLATEFVERRYADGTTEGAPYINNFTERAGPVPPIPLGATYTMSLALQGSEPGARTYGTVVVVPIDQVHVPWWIQFGLSTEARWVLPETCSDHTESNDEDDLYVLWRHCEQHDLYEAGRFGSVTGVPSHTP